MERVEIGASYASQADPNDVQKVLLNALLTFEESTGLIIDRLLRVEFWQANPTVHYPLEPDGRTRISLSATDHFWCQYAYQFTHEVCHIATNYDQGPRPPQPQPFAWLDETICELATWAILRGLHRNWQSNPPIAMQRAKILTPLQYRENVLSEYKGKLDRSPFKEWFGEEQNSLRTNPTQREKNAKIAFEIMPHFYEKASGWRAASALNTWPVHPGTGLTEFFDDWIKVSPNEAETIELVASKFPL